MGGCSGAVILIFRIKSGFIPFRAAPVGPPFGNDVATHFAAEEYRPGKITPRAAQMNGGDPLVSGQPAAEKDVSEGGSSGVLAAVM